MVQKEKKYITWEGLNQHAKNVGKKIKECDTGVIGGYNGSFPLTAATKGNIYLLPATKKYYVCIKNYNGSQLTAPNANFEELSVYTNRSKLDNLFRVMAYNDDCNNYKSTSFCSASHHNMNINNHPFGTNRNFCMIVIYYYYSFQIAFSESGVRYRYYNSDSKSWIPWREL